MKLLLSILLLFLFYGCSDQSKKDSKQVQQVEKKVEVKKEMPKPKKNEIKKVVKKVEPKKEVVKKIVEKTEKIVAKTKEKVKEVAKIATSVTDNKKVKKVVEKVTKALDKIPTAVNSATKGKTNSTGDIQNAAAGLVSGLGGGALLGGKKKNSVDGKALFKSKCSSCHGAKAEKKALGKSEIIAKWDSKKIVDALDGYKKGTFGGSMKAIMQGQAKGLSSDQISALANAIPKL